MSRSPMGWPLSSKMPLSGGEGGGLDFQLTSEQQHLQKKCRKLAADFASRSARHDRDASHPVENYDRLREEGFLALTVGKEWGGSGASFLGDTIAYEALERGCPSTALALFRHTYLNWFWGSYTPVYLGVAQAAFDELRRVVHTRRPEGYPQPLAYAPHARRAIPQ